MNARSAALDFVTGCLGVDERPEAIAALRSASASGRLAWEAVIGLANEHLVTPGLWVALCAKGLADDLPEDVRAYLQELHRLNTERNAHLRRQALEAVGRLNAVGVEPVLLKGAAQLVANTFGDAGARVMTDLDILVPKRELARCREALQVLGYRADVEESAYASHHHCAPLFRPGDYGTVELHRDLLPRSTAHLLPGAVAWRHAQPVAGVSMQVLSPTHRVLHTILHSQVVDLNHERGAIDLRSLHELASMSRVLGAAIDWSAIGALMDRHGKGRVLRAYLYLAHRLYGMAMPDGIRPTPGCVAHYLQARAQVRWVLLNDLVWRFSAGNIRWLYGCRDEPVSLMRARLRYAGYLLSQCGQRALASLRAPGKMV